MAIAAGEKDAARLSPSGPPPRNSTVNPNMSRIATSRPTSTARTRAPSSMLRDPSTCTPAMVITASSHQGTTIPADPRRPEKAAPYSPYIAAWTVLYARSASHAAPAPVLRPKAAVT